MRPIFDRRAYMDRFAWLLNGGAEIGLNGLLGRKTVGKGIAIFCQVDPEGTAYGARQR